MYDAGVRLGAKKEWEFMWQKYQTEIVAEEKKKLLSSLSSSREAWLLERLVYNRSLTHLRLRYFFNNTLKKLKKLNFVNSQYAR